MQGCFLAGMEPIESLRVLFVARYLGGRSYPQIIDYPNAAGSRRVGV
jgi:hypothetical protein